MKCSPYVIVDLLLFFSTLAFLLQSFIAPNSLYDNKCPLVHAQTYSLVSFLNFYTF